VIAAVTIDTLTKFILWQEVDNLGKNSLALVHGEAPFASFLRKNHKTKPMANSNRFLRISSVFNIFTYS
jgi:hypothetical protein